MTKSTTKYSNNARTTLSGSITTSAPTIPVISSVGFPTISSSTDYFLVTIDDGTNVEIVKVTGISGNTFTGCTRGMEGTTPFAFGSTAKVENRLTAGNITSYLRKQDKFAQVASVSQLLPPSQTDADSLIINGLDAAGSPILAVINGNIWRFVNYPDKIISGVTGTGATPSLVGIADIGTKLTDQTANMYMIQFTSGTYMGYCRIISSITSTSVGWATPLAGTPASSDTYEIYRCILSWKSAKGTNSDQIFFENDNTVWSDYAIPANRNAVSAGPVSVNSGVTVTIPSGSSWSIV